MPYNKDIEANELYKIVMVVSGQVLRNENNLSLLSEFFNLLFVSFDYPSHLHGPYSMSLYSKSLSIMCRLNEFYTV